MASKAPKRKSSASSHAEDNVVKRNKKIVDVETEERTKASSKKQPGAWMNGNGHHASNAVDSDSDMEVEDERYFPIAIVGIGCRFPGDVNCPDDFEHVMKQGIDVISEVPADRWDLEKYWHPDPHNVGTHANKKAGFCKDVHDFDHSFYNISPREAANMDVMHRALMEVTQESLDDAGIPSESLPRDTGVYIGLCLMDHGFTVIEDAKCMNAYTHTGTAHSVAANRISFAYDIRGPSVAIDTACAASLTAMHYAAWALWNKECPVALVGACNTLMVPEVTVGFNALGVLSPDGVSCPFSARAKGYVRSEGTGAVVLKPLHEAQKDGDHIYCTLRASWLAHNGYSLSITMPSTDAQAEMMKKTYEVFGLDANTVDFIEAHGTGTPVGDPLEAEGIAQAFTIGNKNRKKPLAVGSSKSNFGHMEGAAGMVQMIKAALMLERRQIFPNINFGEPNPAIDMEGWNIYVPTEVEDFKENKIMRAGVNTFGFGGALAHMIVDEYPDRTLKQNNKGTAGWKFGDTTGKKGLKIPIPLSAKSAAALRGTCAKWAEYNNDNDAMEVACWQASRRSHYSNRLVVFADSSDDFREKMQMYQDKAVHDDIVEGTIPAHQEERKICFIFPGQGQQHFEMGRSLYREEPVFRKAVDDCDAIYKKLSGKSFCRTYNLFVPIEAGKKVNPEVVNEIPVSQPAILFLQLGLYHLMEHWGVKADAVVGHSLGEVAAAYATGAITLEEAVTVQYYRAEQQAKLDGTGSMAAWRGGIEDGEKLCKQYDDLYIACSNAQEAITIAGSKPVIKEICAKNPTLGKELRVKCAFHTPHMDPLEKEFMRSMKGKMKNSKPNKSAWYSTVTGDKYEGAATAQYFWDNIRSRVEFTGAVSGVMRDFPNTLFLELAGSATLLSCVRMIAKGVDYTPNGMVATGQRQKDDRVSTMRALATLHTMGTKLDWKQGLGDCGKWMRLPLYAWQHQTFRYEAEGMRQRRLDLEDRTYKGLYGVVRLEQLPFLRDHVIKGKLVFPRSGYIEYMMQNEFGDEDMPALANIKLNPDYVELPEEVDLNGEVPERKVLNLKKEGIMGGERISIYVDDTLYAQADCIKSTSAQQPQKFALDQLRSRCKMAMTSDELYEKLADVGVDYADYVRFKNIESIRVGDGEALAALHPALDKRERINTITLDAAFTVALSVKHHCSTLLTPVKIDSIKMYVAKVPRKQPLFVYSRLNCSSSLAVTADIYILDEQGNVLAEASGFTAENTTDALTSKLDLKQCVYTTEWQPIESCMPHTKIMKEFFQDANLRQRYPEDMAAIDKAELHCGLVKEICSAYAKYATTQTGPKEVHQKVERYATRLRQMVEQIPTKLTFDELPKRIEQINKLCPEFHQEMIMIERMGRILAESLKDPRGALTELFTEDMMGQYFIDSITVNIYYKAIADTVRLAVEKALESKKIVRVLEIGGRLGGLSKYICKALKDLMESGRVEFIFTDINVAFFGIVQKNLEDYPSVRYQQLDVERDIKTQSFIPNSMDLIVCLDTLHCTEDGVESTANIRDLLCKDGWLMLMESTNNHNTPEIIFGAFDLCWIFEDERKDRCWMSQAGWSGVMDKAGFSDVVAVSTPNEFFHSLIVGRKTETSLNYLKYQEEEKEKMEVDGEPLWVLAHMGDVGIVNNIKSKLTGRIQVTTAQKFKTIQKEMDGHDGPINVAFFWDEKDAELSETMEVIQTIQTLGEKPGSALWVITRECNMNKHNLNAAMAVGLLRTACSEVKNMAVYMIDIENSGILNQVRELTNLFHNHTHNDREIAIRKSTRFVPRMFRHKLHSKVPLDNQDWRVEALSKEENHLDAVDVHKVNTTKPGRNQVRVMVHASAVSAKDIADSVDDSRQVAVRMGSECAGVIECTGPGVVGHVTSDSVMVFTDNCVASKINVSADRVFKKPRNLTMTEAAASGMALASAHYALINRGNLQKNESILIHDACSSTGQAAIEIAKYLRARIICCTQSEDSKAYLKGQCGITHVTGTDTFRDDVMTWTHSRGVDMVVNFSGGDVLQKSLEVLTHGGRLCQMGDRSVFEGNHIVMEALTKNISLHSIIMDELMNQRPEEFQKLMFTVLNILEDGAIRPVPSVVTDVNNMKQSVVAFNENDSNIGNLVLTIPPSFVPAEVEPASDIFRSDATYIITGCSGGVGQELTRWMVERGARHLALVSKTGMKTWFQKNTVAYVENLGATVHEIRTDVTREKDLKSMFRNLSQNGHQPIRGIFHLAGHSQDIELESLTASDLQKEVAVKAYSARMLHEITQELKINLDHFVMFSSSKAAWGTPTLGAFCAACNYLDTLAEQRRASGLPAVSVRVGWVRGAGWLEDKSRAGNMEQYWKGTTMHVREFTSLLHKTLCKPDLPPVVMIANEDWDLVAESTYADALSFRHYASSSGKRKGGSDLSKDDLEKKVVEKLGALLMMPADDIDIAQPMIHYGVDSLISLDITNWMRKEFNLNVNQMDILEGMTTASLIDQALA